MFSSIFTDSNLRSNAGLLAGTAASTQAAGIGE
jgi:hypothetical protein